MRRLLAVAALAGTILFVAAGPAAAHATLEGSEPAADSQFPAGQPPAEVRLQFSEGVQVSDDSVRLLASSGEPVQGVGESEAGDESSVVVAPLPNLVDGTYVIDYRVVSADSHPITGALTFSVGEASASASEVAGLLDNEPDRGIGIAFGLTRALAFGAVLVLIGAIVFLRVCSPVSGADTAVRALLWVCWIVAFVTSFLGIGMQAAYTSGQDVSGLWDTGAIGEVMDTRFGQSWLIRAGLLLLLLPAIVRPSGRRAPAVNGVDALLGILVLATFTFAGHARTGRWVTLGTVTDIVHLSAAAVWLGGVVMLATLLVRRVPTHDAPGVTQRFSRLAAPAIVVIALSGAVQTWRQTAGIDSVLDTTYGRLMLTKIGLFVLIVAAASVSRHIVRLWAQHALVPAGPGALRAEADPEDMRELRNAVIVEVAIAAIVLAVTAILVNTTPARVDAADAATETSGTGTTPVDPAGYQAVLTDGDLQFDVALSPGLRGTNQLAVATTVDGAPFAPLEMTAKLTSTEQEVSLDVPMTIGPNGNATGTVELPFSGTWALEIRALRTDVDQALVTDEVEIL